MFDSDSVCGPPQMEQLKHLRLLHLEGFVNYSPKTFKAVTGTQLVHLSRWTSLREKNPIGLPKEVVIESRAMCPLTLS